MKDLRLFLLRSAAILLLIVSTAVAFPDNAQAQFSGALLAKLKNIAPPQTTSGSADSFSLPIDFLVLEVGRSNWYCATVPVFENSVCCFSLGGGGNPTEAAVCFSLEVKF